MTKFSQVTKWTCTCVKKEKREKKTGLTCHALPIPRKLLHRAVNMYKYFGVLMCLLCLQVTTEVETIDFLFLLLIYILL